MRDGSLQVDTYAEPTPPHTIRQGSGIAGMLEAEPWLATHIDINVPDNWIAERLLHVNAMASAEESKSSGSCQAVAEGYLDTCARAAGVKARTVHRRAANPWGRYMVSARHARARDSLPGFVGDRMDSQRAVAGGRYLRLRRRPASRISIPIVPAPGHTDAEWP